MFHARATRPAITRVTFVLDPKEYHLGWGRNPSRHTLIVSASYDRIHQ